MGLKVCFVIKLFITSGAGFPWNALKWCSRDGDKRIVYRTLHMRNFFVSSSVCVFKGVLAYKMVYHKLRWFYMECFKVVIKIRHLSEMFFTYHTNKIGYWWNREQRS